MAVRAPLSSALHTETASAAQRGEGLSQRPAPTASRPPQMRSAPNSPGHCWGHCCWSCRAGRAADEGPARRSSRAMAARGAAPPRPRWRGRSRARAPPLLWSGSAMGLTTAALRPTERRHGGRAAGLTSALGLTRLGFSQQRLAHWAARWRMCGCQPVCSCLSNDAGGFQRQANVGAGSDVAIHAASLLICGEGHS